MAKSQERSASNAEFDMRVAKASEAATLMKSTRRSGGSRRSVYSPVYEAVENLKSGEFVVLKGIEKNRKLSLYQGVTKRYEGEYKVRTARENDSDGETYTVIIGKASDVDRLRGS